MGIVSENWMRRLSAAVAGSLREFAIRRQGAPITMFAVDCAPWNGGLFLTALSAEAAPADSALLDPAEMAAWDNYDFASGMRCWESARELGEEMRAIYEAASDHDAAAEAFMRACAAALKAPNVERALLSLQREDAFRISVRHPDSGKEYFAPEVV